MSRMHVRSRSGNVVLAVLGAVYAIGASAALVVLAVDVWNAGGLRELAMQLVLIGAVTCGVWFFFSGLENLGVHLPHFLHRH